LADNEKYTAVLDAGCGTGLCGPLVRPVTDSLIGVDLAAPMLDKARSLGVYDDLIETDLIDYLSEHEQSFDLIIAADTFNYFGALDGLFDAAAKALQPDGHVVFTPEKGDDNTREYRLMAHGRFEHERRYIEEELQKNDLSVTAFETFRLRKEGGQDVNGWLIQAQRI